MARARCITMQRDERLLLPAWLRHHGALFGFENLVVLDHGSTDPAVVAILRTAERAGVEVRWTLRTGRDFAERGQHLHNLMRGWEEQAVAYDWAVPLDCDEFLVAWTRTGIDGRPAAVTAELDRHAGEARALSIGDALFNVPGRPGWFVLERSEKAALPAHAAGEIDATWRHATSARAPGHCPTRLATLHFRHKGLREARARAAARGDGAPAQRLALLEEAGEAAFARRFDERLLLGFPGFGAALAAWGIESRLLAAPPPADRRVSADQVAFHRPAGDAPPVWFDGEGYLRENGDVAAADWPAALHYARHGGAERRGAPGERFAAVPADRAG